MPQSGPNDDIYHVIRFELRSIGLPIEVGHEVTISYGVDKGNAQLLRDYGFVIPGGGNPNDRVELADDVAAVPHQVTSYNYRDPAPWLPFLSVI